MIWSRPLPTRRGPKPNNNPGMPVSLRRCTPHLKCWQTVRPAAITVILRTKGCHWWWSSGCTFCGYFNDTRDDVTNGDLHAQWTAAKEKFDNFKDQAMVKVYTSGSLLEDREIPVEFQETVLRDCAQLGKELIVESRCEQLTEEKLHGRHRSIPRSPSLSDLKPMTMKCCVSTSTKASLPPLGIVPSPTSRSTSFASRPT